MSKEKEKIIKTQKKLIAAYEKVVLVTQNGEYFCDYILEKELAE